MYTLRTRFKKDIISEFLPPTRKSNKVIIICTGMPSVPNRKELMFFLAKKGYWVFFPRYRGSWESGGEFLKKSPHEDVLDVIDQLPKGFTSLWDKEKYKINPSSLYLIGGSFGGPAMLLASRDPRVDKAITFSPVVDWKTQAKSKGEPWNPFTKFVKEAFGNAYRFKMKDWNKLKRGGFYDPVAHTNEIPGEKIFIIHAKDDDVVHWRPVEKFAKKIGCKLSLLKKGGHLSASNIMKPSFYKRITRFLSN